MRQILWQIRILLVFDEVYALASCKSRELVAPVPIVSRLALDIKSLSGNSKQVHMILRSTKDSGQSGIRMVVTLLYFVCLGAFRFLM